MKMTMESPTRKRYNDFYSTSYSWGRLQPLEPYVVNMASDIIDELQKRGECWIVEACLSEELKPHWIDIAAVCMAFNRLVTDGGLSTRHTTVEFQDIIDIYGIPSNRTSTNGGVLLKKYRWVLLPLQWYGITQRGKDQAAEQAQKEAQLRKELDALHKKSEELQASNTSLRDEMSKLKEEQTQREAQANEQTAIAAAQLERIRENAEQLVAEEKGKILAEAQAVLERSREEADTAMREKRDQVAKIAREARDELLKENTSEHLTKAHDAIRAEMKQQTQGMQLAILEALKETSEKLSALLANSEGNIAVQMNAWRNSLYEADYRPLASYYCNMYRFINGVIEKDLALQEAEDGTDKTPAVARMIKHQTSLTRYLASLNRTLTALGLSFICPEAGELYDEYLHSADTKENIGEDATIEMCTCPGIRLGDEGKVIIRADVILKAEVQGIQPENEEGVGEK